MIQGLHAVDFPQGKSLEYGGSLLIYDFDGHLCPDQNVSAQPYLGEAALASGVQGLTMTNTGLLVSRDVCKFI